MRVAILEKERNLSPSMDVYAAGLVKGLQVVRPTWEIIQISPNTYPPRRGLSFVINGVRRYYHRYWKYPKNLISQDVDIFHIVDHSDAHLIHWLKKNRQHRIVTCHDIINLVEPELFRGRARFPLISMALWKLAIQNMQDAEHIVSVSLHTVKDIVQNLGIERERITVVPNAVDPVFSPLSAEETNTFREQQKISSDKFCILNVGSNNPRKNIFGILQVIRILVQRKLPIHFWKVGADFNEEQKKFIHNNGIENYITYLGTPNEQTLVKIYSSADALLAPSLYEGFGMTILESMACGTPVITSNSTSIPEVTGDAAILIDPKNITEIAKAISDLQSNSSQYEVLVNKGLARAKLFTWESTAEQIALIYEKVVQQDRILDRKLT